MELRSLSQPVPAPPGLDSLVALAINVASVRACLLENVGGRYRLAAWSSAPRSDGATLVESSAAVLRQMEQRLGRELWDDRAGAPMLYGEDNVRRPPLAHVAIAASPRPLVRTWLAGLSSSQSIDSLRTALASSPAETCGSTLFRADLDTPQLTDQLTDAAPDMVVIAGGYDNPDSDTHAPLLELCLRIGQALARAAPAQRPAVVFAGNRWAAAAAGELIRNVGGGALDAVENVQPAPGFVHKAPLARAVNLHYWRLSRRLPGFLELSRWVTSPGHISSQESCFAQLVQVWMEHQQLQDLHGLWCGPAWWLHVWASRSQGGLQLRYVEPHQRPSDLSEWPPLQLVSGDWPEELWPRTPLSWWDRSGMAPMIASVGQVDPQAMIQVLRTDVLRTID